MSLECKDSLVKFYTSIGQVYGYFFFVYSKLHFQIIICFFLFSLTSYVLEPGNGNSMHIRYGQTQKPIPAQPSWQLATSAATQSKSKL